MHAPLAETPAAAAADSVAQMLASARIRSAGELLDALVARKAELGMSDKTLERLAGLTAGHVAKTLSPGRVRIPKLGTIGKVLDSLQLSVILVRDSSKATEPWEPRNEAKVRTQLGSATIARARPIILDELLRRAVRKRWRDMPTREFLKAQMGERP
jgi:hypothetical protein